MDILQIARRTLKIKENIVRNADKCTYCNVKFEALPTDNEYESEKYRTSLAQIHVLSDSHKEKVREYLHKKSTGIYRAHVNNDHTDAVEIHFCTSEEDYTYDQLLELSEGDFNYFWWTFIEEISTFGNEFIALQNIRLERLLRGRQGL